ncbi:hypothetical protein [Gordonia crocea]|uniref:Uncharacterized protein n=1 Tax=Gordonia crocea TaxID=589162 RepID=A0A7I9UW74_9ACTN|nr:hypothetical protein [Gordonia crocea]GED97096.1 hypothetical protein nbrc107697_11350 [Gordonia crocea]
MSDEQPRLPGVGRDLDFERLERGKDLAQEAVQTTATRVGRIATIITGAVVDVAREIGELITDGFEMREAAKRAKDDAARLDRMARERLVDEEDDDPVIGELEQAPVSLQKAIEAPVENEDR